MKFLTESGSIYEIDGDHIRRVNESYEKRADGEWVRLLETPHVEVGYCVNLILEPLAKYGADDYDIENTEANVTWRRTTPVERVWGGT